jgi:hypothetical protein
VLVVLVALALAQVMLLRVMILYFHLSPPRVVV